MQWRTLKLALARAEKDQLSRGRPPKTTPGSITETTTTADSYYHYTVRDRKSDDDLRDDQRNNALLTAAASGHTHRVSYLLRLGADVDFRDENGLTALHHAALSGFEDTAEALLVAGSDVAAAGRFCGTPLHLAALRGRNRVMTALLQYRADPNAQSMLLGTPLHCAAHSGDAQSVSLLLDHSARITAMALIEFLYMQRAPTLEPNEFGSYSFADCEPLLLAARQGHANVIGVFVAAKASVESYATTWTDTNPRNPWPDDYSNVSTDYTPLHAAVDNYQHLMCEKLLDLGADVDAQEGFMNETPLMYACRSGHEPSAVVLLKAGASLDLCNNERETPMALAIAFNKLSVVAVLIRHGASLREAVKAGGMTPLHLAVRENHPAIVNLFVEYGAVPDQLDEDGRTAIQVLDEVNIRYHKAEDVEHIREILARASRGEIVMFAAPRPGEQCSPGL